MDTICTKNKEIIWTTLGLTSPSMPDNISCLQPKLFLISRKFTLLKVLPENEKGKENKSQQIPSTVTLKSKLDASLGQSEVLQKPLVVFVDNSFNGATLWLYLFFTS